MPPTPQQIVEVRLHGRGGQGTVVASKILAVAAFLEDNGVQSFPTFGVERRGAPVAAFVRFGPGRIRNRSGSMKPHQVIVVDPTLIQAVNVFEGLREGGGVLINAPEAPKVRHEGAAISWVDAAEIAVRHGLGTRATPIVNTAIMGAFARASGLVKLESVLEAIRKTVDIKPEKNLDAAREAYETVTLPAQQEANP